MENCSRSAFYLKWQTKTFSLFSSLLKQHTSLSPFFLKSPFLQTESEIVAVSGWQTLFMLSLFFSSTTQLFYFFCVHWGRRWPAESSLPQFETTSLTHTFIPLCNSHTQWCQTQSPAFCQNKKHDADVTKVSHTWIRMQKSCCPSEVWGRNWTRG